TEQREKIKEIHRSFEARRQELHDRRHDLFQSDLKAIDAILTPEQREKVQAFLEDRVESPEAGEGPVAWTANASLNDSFLQKLRAAAEQIGLTTEQRDRIRERLAGSVPKYREQRHARRALVEEEFQAIAAVLTPEQRDKARRYFEQRLVTA